MNSFKCFAIFFLNLTAASCGFNFNPDGKCFSEEECAADPDLDKIPNFLDNCRGVPNPDQLDSDGDGVGDACQTIFPREDVYQSTDLVADDVHEKEVTGDAVDTWVALDTEEDSETEPDTWASEETADEDIPSFDDVEDTVDSVAPDVETPPDAESSDSDDVDTFVPPLCADDDCDDDNVCTDDHCNPAQGCEHTDNTSACSDNNPCTIDDVCADSVCVSGTNVCDCETSTDCADKNDANLCNGDLVCENTKCVVDVNTIVSCAEAPDPCFENRCEPTSGQCNPVPVPGQSCDDHNLCTTDDVCTDVGDCVGQTPLTCNDDNLCTNDSCNPNSGCQFVTTISCADGNLCTSSEMCNPETGTCTSTPTDCDDNNACTVDSCNPNSGCQHTTTPCTDSNPCTYDTCVPGSGCLFGNLSNDVPCSDGDACTTSDHCVSGACVHLALLNCDDQNPCTDDTCNPETGCKYAANTAPCDDGVPCTVADFCANSSCTSGNNKDCDDQSACTTDSCDQVTGECVHSAIVCDDGVGCTQDSCAPATGCIFTQVFSLCSDADNCTFDACDPAVDCFHLPRDPAYPNAPKNSCSQVNVDGDKWQDDGNDADADNDGFGDNENDLLDCIMFAEYFLPQICCITADDTPGCNVVGLDNCWSTKNVDQLDSDKDHIGDACDPNL